MSKQNDPNKRHYFKEAEREEFVQYIMIQCQKELKAPVTIWIKGEDQESAEIYELQSYDKKTHQLELLPTGKLLTKISGSTKANKEVLLKIPIDEKLNYFTGGLLIFNPKDLSYNLRISQEIFKSQARGNYRLKKSDVIKIQISLGDKKFDAYDLSLGGISLIVDQKHLDLFRPGSEIEHFIVHFNLNAYPITKARIINNNEFDNEPTLKDFKKVGIAFTKLNRKVEDELYIKISTEARGQEIKTQFDNILQKKDSNS